MVVLILDLNISILFGVFLRLIANLVACQSIVTRKLQIRNVFFFVSVLGYSCATSKVRFEYLVS